MLLPDWHSTSLEPIVMIKLSNESAGVLCECPEASL